jgi:outer membrane autotransporter protein
LDKLGEMMKTKIIIKQLTVIMVILVLQLLLNVSMQKKAYAGEIELPLDESGNIDSSDSGTLGSNIYVPDGTTSPLASNNIVDVTGQLTYSIPVVGGLIVSGTGSVSGNTVNIGYAVTGNTITGISQTAAIGGLAYQGSTNVTGNIVTIANGLSITGDVYGGLILGTSGTGNVTGNTVELKGATITGNVYAGHNAGTGNTEGNRLFLSRGGNTISGTVMANFLDIIVPFVTGQEENLFTGPVTVSDEINIGGCAGVNNKCLGLRNIFLDGINSPNAMMTMADETIVNIASGKSITARKIYVTSGAELGIPSGTAITVTEGLKIDDYGLLYLYEGDSTISGDVVFNNNSIISYPIYSAPGLSITGSATVNGIVDIESDPALSLDQILLTAASLIDSNGSFFNFLYDLYVDGNTLKVGGIKSNPYKKYIERIIDGKFGITSNYQSVATLIDNLLKTGNNTALLDKVDNLLYEIKNISDSTIKEIALKQFIGEGLVNVNSAVASTAIKSQGVVFGRLDSIRGLGGILPPAAGSSDEAFNRIWVGGYGVWGDAKNRNGVYGYEYKAGGVSLGYDRVVDSVPGLRLGLSTTFSSGKLDNNDKRTSIDIDTVGIGLYGSYLWNEKFFVDASIAYGKSKNDYDVNLVIQGKKTGSFDIDTWQFGLRFGTILKYGNFQFIPNIGVLYMTFDQEGWKESTKGVHPALDVANWFKKSNDHQVDIPVQLRINTTFDAGSATITPELRLGWTYAAKEANKGLDVGFVGSNQTAHIQGIKPSRNTFQVGAGVKVKTPSIVDFFVNYDLDSGKEYKNHSLSAGLGIDF